jgi:hypothetical protein
LKEKLVEVEWNCVRVLFLVNSCGFCSWWKCFLYVSISLFALNLVLFNERTVDIQGCNVKIDFHKKESRTHLNWNIPL